MSKGKRIRGNRMAKQPEKPVSGQNAIGKFAQLMQQAAEKKRNAVEQPDPNQFNLAKPDEQMVGDAVIQWAWKHPLVGVFAYYARKTPNIQNRNAGDYWVEWDFDDDFSGELNVDEVKLFAETLLSAYRWAEVWQQHMGEFFTADTTPKLTVVDEAINDAVEDDDNDDEDSLDTHGDINGGLT